MSQFNDDKDIFSRSEPEDVWSADSLLDDSEKDISWEKKQSRMVYEHSKCGYVFERVAVQKAKAERFF